MKKSLHSGTGLSIILVLFILSAEFSHAKDNSVVTIYEHMNYEGKSREIYLQRGRCFPLFGEWADEISSIKLDSETCVVLYQNGECQGEGKVLFGGSKKNAGSNLYYSSMNDAIESIQLCD